MKRWIGLLLVLVVTVGAVWFGVSFKRAADRRLDASERGHIYRNFFIVLEMYTEQNGSFPASLDDMLLIRDPVGSECVSWPEDAERYVALIEPNFEITPTPENLGVFAPDYQTRAEWADYHCEFHWQRILEHLADEP